MRTFFIILLIGFLANPAGYAQRNAGKTGDDGRLDHNDKSKLGQPKTDPRNPPSPIKVTNPPKDNQPVRPTGRPINIRPVYTPPVVIDQPDLPPPYDPSPTPPVYTIPETTSEPFVDYKTLGKKQFDDEDYFNAFDSFQLALAGDTSDYSLYYQLGITEIELGRYVDAIHSLSKFIKSVTYNGMGYYQRGLAKFYLGKKDKAFSDFQIADELNVEDVKLILKRFYNY
jgi:tetratricopeptide (TPR) repeat protein